MTDKVLSIFIDESGDFGQYESHAPFYFVTMVLHDRSTDISANISSLEDHLRNLGYEHHAVHTGPLIRRESDYINEQVEGRRRLFNALFNFARKTDFKYICVSVNKRECKDAVDMTAKLSKALANALKSKLDYFQSFDKIVVHYDNGQTELTRVLTSVFNTLFGDVEFERVCPADYKLFQVADLICTAELLNMKLSSNALTKSEQNFFKSGRDFKKNYYKTLEKKQL